MKAHLSNAVFGILDYTAYPIGMLLAAPALLRHVGVTQYGLWMLATAAVSAGSIIASGFGDANIQHIAKARSQKDMKAVVRTVRSTMAINLLLGIVLMLTFWLSVPHVVGRIAQPDADSQKACLWSLRIASVLILVRAIESVCISTQRAFERYGAAVRISILARMLTLVAAVLLACRGLGVVSIMIGTGILVAVGTIAQLVQLQQHLGTASLLPYFDQSATVALLSFGIFSWFQAVSGVIFTQIDRLMLGVSLGATAVTAYVLCVQMAQPIYGIAAAGLHFLFPHLAGLETHTNSSTLNKTVLSAIAANLAFVAVATAAELLLGHTVLHLWVGVSIAEKSAVILAPIVWGFALLGLNVTGYYALLALGEVRTVTMLGILGGAVMVALMVLLLPRIGINGLAIARLSYGAISLFVYYPLFRRLHSKSNSHCSAVNIYPSCEDI